MLTKTILLTTQYLLFTNDEEDYDDDELDFIIFGDAEIQVGDDE